jgi:hypothetical protein
VAAAARRLGAHERGYEPNVTSWLQKLRQLFNRGRDRDPLLSDETPAQDFGQLPASEQERELEKSPRPAEEP